MPLRSFLAFATALLLCVPASAAEPAPDTTRGDRMLDAYFRHQTRELADACLADIKTKADWEKKRPELHRQFMEMLGLAPLPAKTDLKPVVTGKVETEHFTIEKLQFQSLPGLYVTGNLYIPKKATFPAPTILYVCGHGNTVVDKVSFGSKVNYQHHPAWFAEHGYVCLVIDTLQLGEIEGIHHGTNRFGMWWWFTLGYTPAGIECWNSIRALDYLETRKEVDKKRFGVTGRSGGGAYSWWLAAADERVQCIVPVAGIVDMWAQLIESTGRLRTGAINGHCDCMFFHNTYRWDFPMVAALCAPRPLLLGNSDVDDIFPVAGYKRLYDKAHKVYDLYGAGEKFQLLETTGPHQDTPELRLGAFAWMNRWLKDDRNPVTEEKREKLAPPQLKVFERLPEDQINTTIQEVFIKPARPELPRVPEVARAWWASQSKDWLMALKDKTFRGWPHPKNPLAPMLVADVKHNGLRLRAFDFQSDDDFELRLWLMTADNVDKPALTVLTVVDEAGWQDWLKEVGPGFKDALLLKQDPVVDEKKLDSLKKTLTMHKWAFATLAPRGIGPTRWAEVGTPADVHIRRRFGALGQTLDGQRVWDVRQALASLRRVPDLQAAPLWLQGKNDMAGVVLYAGLFEPDVARLDLWNPPASHRQGPILFNVCRILDMPQALALAFPKQIRMYVKNEEEARKTWDWTLSLQKALGQEYLKIRQVAD